jgi:hypothetical protein
VLNARYLQHFGYGVHAPKLTSEALGGFLEKIPDCEKKLASYQQDGNTKLLGALDELLAQVQRGASPPPEETSTD